MNLSCLDAPIRLRVPMGLAPGTDSALVERLLLKAGRKCPLVLQTPAPQVFLKNMGGAAMLFELAVWYSSAKATRQQVASALNFAISEALRARQIRTA